MSTDEWDYFRGWQAAVKGDPFDQHESEKWQQGYRKLKEFRSQSVAFAGDVARELKAAREMELAE